MLRSKFSVVSRKLWSIIKSGDRNYLEKIHQVELEKVWQSKLKSIRQDGIRNGEMNRRFPVRYFLRRLATVHDSLLRNQLHYALVRIPARRNFSGSASERLLAVRSARSCQLRSYIGRSDRIGDEMRNDIVKRAPGSTRSMFGVFQAGKVESKEKRSDCKPKEKPCKKKKDQCEGQETVKCKEPQADEVEECCEEDPCKKKKKAAKKCCKASDPCPKQSKWGSKNKCQKECPPEPPFKTQCVPCQKPACPPVPNIQCTTAMPRCCPPPCPCPPPPCPPPCPPTPPPPCCPAPCSPKMEALQFDPCKKCLNFYMLNAPTSIRKDEVLVQVVYSGVCSTDLRIIEGKFPVKNEPLILGHEFSGIACAVGSGVSHIKCGDCIVINPYATCNTCRYCTRGQFGACLCEGLNTAIGFHKDGGWAEFVVVHKNQVFQIPPCLSLSQAILCEPLSCIVNAASRLHIPTGASIVIQGVSVIGSLWACLFHLQGHRNVTCCDKSDYKRKLFECLDLNFCVLPPEKMNDVKADVIIDCTGSGKSVEKSIQMLNPNGQLCVFGISSQDEEISVKPYDLTKKEITIVSVVTNTNSFSQAIAIAEMMGCRYLDYEKLGMQQFKLGQYEGAIRMKKCGEISKVVFNIQNCK